jgi:transposase
VSRAIGMDVHRDFCEVAIVVEGQVRSAVTDVFGVAGRRWLSALELPDDEHETVAGCLRHVDFLDAEVTLLDQAIAREALRSQDVLRLMTVHGVSVITATTFVAAIGDIRRFVSARKLVGYLGLAARVRQSGQGPARRGRITKQGSAAVRHVLVEAAWVAVRAPGPPRAFYERIRARRCPQVAAVATARKLASLFWCLLTRQQDYAFGQPSLTTRKTRRLELDAGAPSRKGQVRAGDGAHRDDIRDAERALALQAERAYRTTINDWKATGPNKTGASVTPGRIFMALKGTAARQTTSPDVCASLPSIACAHHQASHSSRRPTSPLDFHPSPGARGSNSTGLDTPRRGSVREPYGVRHARPGQCPPGPDRRGSRGPSREVLLAGGLDKRLTVRISSQSIV